jgi:hypothetical protein
MQRLRAIASTLPGSRNHFGIDRIRCFLVRPVVAPAVVDGLLMVILLPKGDGRLLLADPHCQRGTARVDRQVPVTQPTDQIKRFTRWLRPGQTQGVVRHCRLDRRAHRRGGPEEPIRRRCAVEPLMRPLEVVVLEEVADTPLAVLEVSKDRA